MVNTRRRNFESRAPDRSNLEVTIAARDYVGGGGAVAGLAGREDAAHRSDLCVGEDVDYVNHPLDGEAPAARDSPPPAFAALATT